MLIISSEGIGIGSAPTLAREIMDKTGLDTRGSVLGYAQRGGAPSPRDLIMGTRMGIKAVELLISGEQMKVLGMNQEKITVHDIDSALMAETKFDHDTYFMVQTLWDKA